jgi:hypothetical protein
MVVEGYRPEQVRERDTEGIRDDPKDLLRQIPVPIMEGVENRQKGCRLLGPMIDDLFVGPYSHQGLQTWKKRPPDIPEGERTVRE